MASTPPPSAPLPPAGRRAPVRLIGAAVAAALALGAFAIVTLAPGGSPAPARAATATPPLTVADYTRLATAACKPAAADPEPAVDEWERVMARMTAAHEALTPPAELAKVHAELVRTDKILLGVFRKINAAHGDQQVVRRYFPREMNAIADREKLKSALPGCSGQ